MPELPELHRLLNVEPPHPTQRTFIEDDGEFQQIAAHQQSNRGKVERQGFCKSGPNPNGKLRLKAPS